MLDTRRGPTKMNEKKSNGDYGINSADMDKKGFAPWSSLEERKVLFKHRYVSCSRSVPRRNKQLVRCKISRSQNFDTNILNSSSENSSFEEDKYLSRSAKIMRALNFNSSPYRRKTKIKRSLNFNVTPSPKRFLPMKKKTRKSFTLKLKSPLSTSKKVLDFNDDPSDSANSSLLFTSSDSIDENQNETPSRETGKECETLHYSTPNEKLSGNSLPLSANYTPVLRSHFKQTSDEIIYVAATPNTQSLKHIKRRSRHRSDILPNTSRNLFFELYEKDDERPCTPENVIRIIPESMSAIKRSHKKERSRRSEHGVTQLSNTFVAEAVVTGRRGYKGADPVQHFTFVDGYSAGRNSDAKDVSVWNSEDDISDTGSLFDYTGEQENLLERSKETSTHVAASGTSDLSNFHEIDIEVTSEKNVGNLSEIQGIDRNDSLEELEDANTDTFSIQDVDINPDDRSGTPDPTVDTVLGSEKTVTPENCINFFERIARDSIKKSHKKNKDDKKKKLFSPKVLRCQVETADPENVIGWQSFEPDENVTDKEFAVEQQEDSDDKPSLERACTPENVNSSRLLLSQYSSVKKSHKKDKHKKILCGFLKRQEYFTKELNLSRDTKNKEFNDLSSDTDSLTNDDDYSSPAGRVDRNTFSQNLSPRERTKLLNDSFDGHTSASFELRECDMSKEEFEIFTPLRRKRSLIAFNAKEYMDSDDSPAGKDDVSEEGVPNIGLSRCLTPVRTFHRVARKADDDDVARENPEVHDYDSNDTNGRSTPRNMSTAELYSNLDSIKKSHKKNKRGIGTRSECHSADGNLCPKETSEISLEDIEKETHVTLGISNDSFEPDNVEASTSRLSNESPNKDTAAMLNLTPPNCIKAKNYMRHLRETSIKRSHKKVRDKKKLEYTADANDLSDDGSIFGDQEKSPFHRDISTQE